MINIYVNGQEYEVPAKCTILELLSLRNLDHKTVVVEKNEKVVQSKEFSSDFLSAGDKLEILQFVGGG